MAHVGVIPAAEAVLQVPGTLAVQDLYRLVGSHGGNTEMRRQLEFTKILRSAFFFLLWRNLLPVLLYL